jgi:hypothetical protein
MITREFQPSAALFYQASREIRRLKSGSKPLFYVLLGSLLLLSLAYRDELGGLFFGIPTWGLMVGVVSFFLVSPLIEYLTIAKNLKRSPTMSSLQQYEISEKGLRNHGGGFSTELSWEMISHVRVSGEFVFFFFSKNCAHFLPKSLLSESEIAQIQAWKSAHNQQSGSA